MGFDLNRPTVSLSALLQSLGGKFLVISIISSYTISPISVKVLLSAPARWAENKTLFNFGYNIVL